MKSFIIELCLDFSQSIIIQIVKEEFWCENMFCHIDCAFSMSSVLFITQEVTQIVHKCRWILFLLGSCVACIDVSFIQEWVSLYTVFLVLSIYCRAYTYRTKFAYVFCKQYPLFSKLRSYGRGSSLFINRS